MFVETKKEGEVTDRLHQFIEWLRTKPPEEGYDVMEPRICAYAQYSGHFVPDINDVAKELGISGGAAAHILGTKPWTFGAALERARAITPTYR